MKIRIRLFFFLVIGIFLLVTGIEKVSAQSAPTPAEQAILTARCEPNFTHAECATMRFYLDSLRDKCLSEPASKPTPSFDCALIPDATFDNVARAYATSYEAYISRHLATPTPTADRSADDSEDDFGGLPDPAGGIKAILENFLMWLLKIIGMLAIIGFVISGAQYFLASGSEKMLEKAKRSLTYSIIGTIVALSGLVIVRAIDTLLRGLFF